MFTLGILALGSPQVFLRYYPLVHLRFTSAALHHVLLRETSGSLKVLLRFSSKVLHRFSTSPQALIRCQRSSQVLIGNSMVLLRFSSGSSHVFLRFS